MAKRIMLFLGVNLLIMVSISFILNLLNVQPYLTSVGLDIKSLMIFCLVWGMGGSLISLLLSKPMAKMAMGVKVITPNQAREDYEVKLVALVHQLSRKAGIQKMPEVGIYQSPEINAFATGPTKNNALVAVSTGLLDNMNLEEVEGVLGHEVAHIANGDMVTMTLLQGIVNAFVMFLARIIAFALTSTQKNNGERNSPGIMYPIVVFVLEMVLMVLGMLVVAWFSRYREYRADEGGAKLAGKQKMISALSALREVYGKAPEENEPKVAALKISGKYGLLKLFSTHPDLEDRIKNLQRSHV